MNSFKVTTKFKNDTDLFFTISVDGDLQKSIQTGWEGEDVFRIGPYFLVVEEILWMKIEREGLIIDEKPSRKKLPNKRKKVK